MTTNRLSHSSVSKFQECPKAWEYHYRHGYRPKAASAALLFGSAIEVALTSVVVGKSDAEILTDFDKAWNFQRINDTVVPVPHCLDIVYAEQDFDEELLTSTDRDKICTLYKIPDDAQLSAAIKKVYEEKEYFGFAGLDDDRKDFLNYINWTCMYQKGLHMIEACKRDILPNIEQVYSVQEEVLLANDDGDGILGYVDIVVKWKGIADLVILDFKTSAKKYAKDVVLTAPQLTLYVHALCEKYKTRTAGFLVFEKRMEKNKQKICSKCKTDGSSKKHRTCDVEVNGVRCHGDWIVVVKPSARTQIIIDQIPEQTEDIVIDNMDFINRSIKNGIFHRNFGSCSKSWGKCSFWNKCFRGSDDGLIQVEVKSVNSYEKFSSIKASGR